MTDYWNSGNNAAAAPAEGAAASGAAAGPSDAMEEISVREPSRTTILQY